MGPIILLAFALFTPESRASLECQNGGITCQAFWTGAEYVERGGIGICVSMSTSGCSNPFSYQSLDDCSRAHGGDAGPTCKAFWVGYEFNHLEGRCQRVTATGCSNPFNFRTLAQCQRYHPELVCLGGR